MKQKLFNIAPVGPLRNCHTARTSEFALNGEVYRVLNIVEVDVNEVTLLVRWIKSLTVDRSAVKLENTRTKDDQLSIRPRASLVITISADPDTINRFEADINAGLRVTRE